MHVPFALLDRDGFDVPNRLDQTLGSSKADPEIFEVSGCCHHNCITETKKADCDGHLYRDASFTRHNAARCDALG